MIEKKRPLLPAILLVTAVLSLNGCLDYPRPPLAVDESSYSALQEKEKNMLPQDLRILTLEQAQALALANNPDFASIKFSIDSARARYYQQFSNYAPTVNASMGISQSFNKIYASGNHTYPRNQQDSFSPGFGTRNHPISSSHFTEKGASALASILYSGIISGSFFIVLSPLGSSVLYGYLFLKFCFAV